MKLSRLSEMAVTTGDIGAAPRPGKKKKKQDKYYRNDPVTGQSRKGRKEAGQVVMDSEEEEEDAHLPVLVQEYKRLLRAVLSAPEKIEYRGGYGEAYPIANQLARWAERTDSSYQFFRDFSELHQHRHDEDFVFGQPTEYDPVGFGLYRPKVRQRRLKQLMDTVFNKALIDWANWAKHELIKEVDPELLIPWVQQGVNTYGLKNADPSNWTKLRDNLDDVLSSEKRSLRNYYKQSIDYWNQKIAPAKKKKEIKPRYGMPQIGVHKGEMLADFCPAGGCKKCANAKTYEQMCWGGKRNLLQAKSERFTQSLADVGLKPPRKRSVIDKMLGRHESPGERKIPPKGRRPLKLTQQDIDSLLRQAA